MIFIFLKLLNLLRTISSCICLSENGTTSPKKKKRLFLHSFFGVFMQSSMVLFFLIHLKDQKTYGISSWTAKLAQLFPFVLEHCTSYSFVNYYLHQSGDEQWSAQYGHSRNTVALQILCSSTQTLGCRAGMHGHFIYRGRILGRFSGKWTGFHPLSQSSNEYSNSKESWASHFTLSTGLGSLLNVSLWGPLQIHLLRRSLFS